MSFMDRISEWVHHEDPEWHRDNGYEGFVYRIAVEWHEFIPEHGIDIEHKRYYVGKKSFWRRRKSKKYESNWKEYLSSSREMQELCKEHPEGVTRRILAYGKKKGDLSWIETEFQVKNDVLRDPSYLNRIVNCRIQDTHLSK